jgi:hypothetical protein
MTQGQSAAAGAAGQLPHASGVAAGGQGEEGGGGVWGRRGAGTPYTVCFDRWRWQAAHRRCQAPCHSRLPVHGEGPATAPCTCTGCDAPSHQSITSHWQHVWWTAPLLPSLPSPPFPKRHGKHAVNCCVAFPPLSPRRAPAHPLSPRRAPAHPSSGQRQPQQLCTQLP